MDVDSKVYVWLIIRSSPFFFVLCRTIEYTNSVTYLQNVSAARMKKKYIGKEAGTPICEEKRVSMYFSSHI